MPNIDSELVCCFSSIDFVSRYWQLPLDEKSQKMHTFMTAKEFGMPTRTLQGARNSGANFQSRVEPRFADIRQSLRAWLDDFAVHAPS